MLTKKEKLAQALGANYYSQFKSLFKKLCIQYKLDT